MSIKKIISSNIKYNTISQVVVFAVNFAMFPFIVSHVGKEIYGIYLLVMALTGYLGVLEFGVTAAVTKYVAELTAKGDEEKVKKIISASFSLFCAIGVAVAVILFVLSFWFDRIFSIEPANKEIARQVLWVAAPAALFIWPGKIFSKVLDGFQRYDWLAAIKIGKVVLIGISAYIIFSRGLGIVYFVFLSYFFIAIEYIMAYFIVRHYFLRSNIIFPYFNMEVFKMIFGFSFFLFLSNVVNLFIFDFDSFIIGTFVSVSALTLYGVGFNLQSGFRAINSLIGSPLFPAGADMEGRNEYDKQKNLFFKGTKYMTLVFIPLVIITIIFAEIFITNWMGKDFAASILPAQILISFWLFNSITEVGSGLLVAKGYIKVLFKIIALNALINVGLSLVLARFFGIVGVALGTSVPMILIVFPLIMYQILRILKVSFWEFFNLSIKKNIWVYIFTVFLSLISLKVFLPGNIFLTIGQMFVVYASAMLIAFIFFLSPEERREVLFMVKP